jgi:hypothetical protein
MKKLNLYCLILALFIILANSCSPPVYHATMVNTPLLSNEGEINAAMNISVSGFEPQIAYALTDNVGLMLNGCFNKISNDNSIYYQRVQFLEIGTGYYTKIQEYVRFEAYGGLGFGNNIFYYHNNNEPYTENVPFTKFFVQPAIGSTMDFVDAAFSSRFVLAVINDTNASYYRYYIEPTVTLKIGYRYVKFVMQGGFSLPFLDDNAQLQGRLHQPLMLGFGIQANINKIYD